MNLIDQIQRKSSMEEVRKSEMAYFKGNPAYDKLSHAIGVDYLKNYLHK